MSTLDLLRIGRKNKKNFLDLSHDVNTTSDFGFCQPTLCDLVIPGSNVKLTTKEFCRLGILPTPTFGRVKIHTDTSFQKVKDVFPAFDNLMSQTLVNNPNVDNGYIPQGHNYFSKGDLISALLQLSFHYARLGEWDKVPFRFDVFFNGPLLSTEVKDDWSQLDKLYPWRSIVNDPSLLTGERVLHYMLGASDNLAKLFGPNGIMYGSDFFGRYNADHYDIRDFNVSTGSFVGGSKVNNPPISLFMSYSPERTESVYNDNRTHNFTSIPFSDGGLGYMFQFDGGNVSYDAIMSAYKAFPAVTSEPITIQNCDYYYIIDNSKQSYITIYDDDDIPAGHNVNLRDDNKFVVCLKLTAFGRRLLKVITGLNGTDCFSKYIPDYPEITGSAYFDVSSHDVISLTPFFAYFKHWFDLYNPHRSRTWYDTNAFKLIHSFYDFPLPLFSWFLSFEDGDKDPSSPYSYLRLGTQFVSLRKAFFDFLVDLGQCVYVLPVDNITVATPQPVGNVQEDVNKQSLYFGGQTEQSESLDGAHSFTAPNVSGNMPYGDLSDSTILESGGLGVKMLMRLYPWANKNNVLRQNFRALLKKYGIQLPADNILDRSDYYAQIDDVFSTAETQEGYLAQYAGKGIGSGVCSCHLEDTKEYGFLIQTLCIAPHSGYVQCNKVYPITRMEHYQPEFDSLGYEAMSMRQVYARDFNLSAESKSRLFGYRPRFFDLKVKNNLCNGYFANRGSMSQYLPYSLDRLFAVPDIDSSISELTFTQGYYPLANEDIRKVGLCEQLGEYDRIFVDNTGMVDNFIFNILQDYKVWSPVKPVSDSFDTFDPETDDDSYNVAHS